MVKYITFSPYNQKTQ